MRSETRDQLWSGLEDVIRIIGERQPKRHEPRSALTIGYAQLLLAISFARIDTHRAKAVFDEAQARIAPRDPIHTFLVTALSLRLDDAIAGRPMRRFHCAKTRASFIGLDRVERYKALRFVETLRTVDANELDAIAMFSGRDNRAPSEPPAWETSPEHERAHQAELLLDTDLATVFDMLMTLPEHLAMPVAVRAATLAEGSLACRALEVLAHFGWGELAEATLAKVRMLDTGARVVAFPGTIRALRKLGARSEMAELCAQLEHEESLAPLVAGAWAFLGDARWKRAFDAAFAKKRDDRHDTREWIRMIARGYAVANVRDAMDGARWLATFACTTTDSLGTSTHYTWSVVHVVSSICLVFDEICDD
jgi:hypothetical protein